MLKPSFLSNEYMVSDEGYVLSKNNKPLKPSINHKGYCIVNLIIDGYRKGVAVHTLVARAFCDGYQPGLTVNHKDGNKTNNKASNLEWVTSYDNYHHAIDVLGFNNCGSNNYNAKRVTMIDKMTGKINNVFESVIDAAKYLEPNSDYDRLKRIRNSISRVALGLRKSYKGYIWKYN